MSRALTAALTCVRFVLSRIVLTTILPTSLQAPKDVLRALVGRLVIKQGISLTLNLIIGLIIALWENKYVHNYFINIQWNEEAKNIALLSIGTCH